ncbi:MAG: hypothetical protein JNJ61_29055 [Anaerolineae bacterium]|nr:hypothetical protein [Anaerolineae bacterium]
MYLRARYYSPALGVFASRDPFEGVAARAMSLNGYSWVEGNVANVVDPSGMIGQGDHYSCHCGWLDWGILKDMMKSDSSSLMTLSTLLALPFHKNGNKPITLTWTDSFGNSPLESLYFIRLLRL